MSKILMILARRLLFGPSPRRELPRDPLPGLNVPRVPPKPPIPYNPVSNRLQQTPMDEIYDRFLKEKPKSKPAKPRQEDKNWPNSMSGK